jgi:proline dehydrogenase
MPVAKHFIAGVAAEDAIEKGRTLNRAGFGVILNYLGEEITTSEKVQQSLKEYIKLLDLMQESRMSGCISVKLTQIGLSISKDMAASNLSELIERARSHERYIWLDMENSKYNQDTIEIYCEALKKYRAIGIAIQAYLRKSESDLERILGCGGQVRLVKGAYKEPDEVIFKGREEIRRSFTSLLERLFSQGNFFAVGTHDEKLLRRALQLVKESRNQNFEFQMLQGVRPERAEELVNSGFKVSIYVPYGESWLPYSVRRIKERRRNIIFMLRAIFHI